MYFRHGWLMLLVLLTFAGGCRLMSRPRQRTGDVPVPIVPSVVLVGGRVAKGGSFAISPNAPLSLRQAILLAGGAVRCEPNADPCSLFVGLRRAKGIAWTVTYFPLSMVEHDLAGNIPLRSGDEITVERAADTTLGSDHARLAGPTGNGQPFAMRGLVADPGPREIGQKGTVNAHPMTRIHDILGSANVDRSATLVVLTRRSASGLQSEAFALPLQSGELWGLIPGDSPIVGGDIYTFGPITVSPLLMTALIDPLVRERL